LEVVDLRSLSPLDFSTVIESVRRTRRAVVVHEASSFVGLGAEISARLSEELYYEMEAPVLRVTGYDVPYPPSRVEEEFLPDLDRVLHIVDRSLGY
jgi:pyruvate dehydrogenase E1 component beta subunit